MNNDYTKKLIYEIPHSIPDLLCDDIISLFEECKELHRKGNTLGGVQENIKKTTDMEIPKNDPKWKKIEVFLYKELNKALTNYTKELRNIISEYKLLDNELSVNNFMIQKYKQNDGKYTYHHDFTVDYENNRCRVITFLWYLNDVVEGGETEFFGTNKCVIRPEKGKLLLFPASWCFPHRGCMPLSGDKYIITNWFYE